MFRNILLAYDGSPAAQQALTVAIDLAQSERSRLTILTAIERPSAMAPGALAAGSTVELSVRLEVLARGALERAVRRVPADVPVTKIITREPIRDALMSRVGDGGHDLLVIGSRGRGGWLRSLVLGPSVGRYAVGHCPVPVMVAHEEPATQAREASSS